ncbi:NhaP-type Na+/H+ or K+/H+ antiporter [Microbacterium azadirachtae]|uniref:NhaP-type Na+/H+ or K+/H+ antiporter n=1 Tax=Microbacterium azadirachtae TaxID=582680 RepID=A0A1I6HV75_9MICO|nr:cation:proton antiporter [Microbacterium azadirachtae]SFR58327.1 NhaP-type Na+/H+ or K+/H+ antiporter [Microbacterium azadirachtae]
MPPFVLIGLIAVLLWSLISHRFERWGIAGPAMLLVLGAGATVWNLDAFGVSLDSPVTEKVVEVVLSVLLFADATEVRGGIFGGEGRVTTRLVLIALPLSLLLTAILCGWLVPESFAVIGVIACVIMPTDFAPATRLLRSRLLPERVRAILNVESGYNDGLVSPIFGMALPIAVIIEPLVREYLRTGKDTFTLDDQDVGHNGEKFLDAFLNAVPATLVAIVIGVALGGLVGLAMRAARDRGVADAGGARFVMVLLPLIAYGIATIPALEANGFVAAFVAGLIYRVARTGGMAERVIPHEELLLVEEVGTLTANFVWFMLGGATLLVFTVSFDLRIVLLALLALTLLRLGPVYLSLMGSSVSRGDRVRIGLLGPRGTATIVFGLLAYNALPDDAGDLVLTAMVTTVVGSILLHGVLAPLLLRRLAPKGDDAAKARVPSPGH